nr:NAD(P)H-hydrate dehydratase [Candidatus Eremiobacteraeota bacterium]
MPASKPVDAALLRAWPLPLPEGGDKNARGSVFVVAGAPQMPGAAILCATATLRAGAGKLQIGTCASVAAHVGSAVPESLVVALAETASGAVAMSNVDAIAGHANEADALVIGPGMVDESATAALIVAVAQALDVPTVIDAAALACFHERADALQRLAGRVVLTPHAGEMAAMLSCERAEVEADPAAYALDAARRFNVVVALKGETTHIAEPNGALYRNEHGNVGLATSGSGDVLAGVIGGLLARGAPPLAAAAWGVYLHARAGDVLARRIGFG